MRPARLAAYAAFIVVAACSDATTTQSNRPPDLESPGALLATEGHLLSFEVKASDLDDDPLEPIG